MIPDNFEELRVLAGEYVLGVLDAHEANEVAAALAINSELRRAVAFWEEQLHPLSSLAASAEPPPGTWQAIEVRIRTNTAKPVAHSFWTNLALWRWSAVGFAAVAAALALWIAVTSVPGLSLVAILHPPQQDQASWIATAGRSGLVLRAVTTATPPSDRVFELWAIAPGATQPLSLGVISPSGELKLSRLPPDLRDGATLAISIEPIGGSPNTAAKRAGGLRRFRKGGVIISAAAKSSPARGVGRERNKAILDPQSSLLLAGCSCPLERDEFHGAGLVV